MENEVIRRGPGRPPRLMENVVVAEKVVIKDQQNEKPVVDKRVLAKTVQLGVGVDLLGSALSLNAKLGNILEVTPIGIRAVSKKNGRIVLIPWANIRAAELIP